MSADIEIKGNEEADKAAKQAINMPEITTTRLPHTDYCPNIRKAKGMGKILVSYTTLNHASMIWRYEFKLSRRDSRKKYYIQSYIRTLLGKDCEMEKMMRFLWKMGCLRKHRDDRRLKRSASLKQCIIVIDDFDAG